MTSVDAEGLLREGKAPTSHITPPPLPAGLPVGLVRQAELWGGDRGGEGRAEPWECGPDGGYLSEWPCRSLAGADCRGGHLGRRLSHIVSLPPHRPLPQPLPLRDLG